MVTEILWGDGTSDKIYFSAAASEGDQTVAVSSDANAGAERSKTVNFTADGVSPQPLAIVQLGAGGTDFDAWVKDGDTHLWIDILNDYQLEQQIRIRMIGTIDWGDGSAKDSANVTTYTTFTHTYSEKGKYRIDLHPTSGTFYLGGASSNYNVMGTRDNASSYRFNSLYQVEIGTSIINTISNYAFYSCVGLLRLYIPKTITTLGTNFCYGGYALREVIFEDPLSISSATLATNFYSCYSLQKMTPFAFASGGTTLNGATRATHSLTDFTIPSTITDIAANCFQNTYSLKALWCLPTSAPTVANSNAFTGFPSTCVIYVPSGSLSSYQGKQHWSTYSSQMVEGATIKYTLTNVTRDNVTPMVAKNTNFTTNLEAKSGYTLGTVTVKMGGTDITSAAYSAGVVTIANVTGNIEITATAS